MSNAFLMLGNIRTLVLSWNQLSTVAGLERMYSLERLAIDYNNIQYLQDAAGLANLPEPNENGAEIATLRGELDALRASVGKGKDGT